MPRVMAFFRNLLRRDRVERDLDNELRATWDLLVDEKIRAGLQPDEARRAAMLELNGIEPVKEKVRDVAAADTLLKDVRYAARLVRRAPGFSSVVIATLALGIGLTTAAFSVVNGILVRPLPFDRPDELVALHTTRERGDTFDDALSAPNFMSVKEEESRAAVPAALRGAVRAKRLTRAQGIVIEPH